MISWVIISVVLPAALWVRWIIWSIEMTDRTKSNPRFGAKSRPKEMDSDERDEGKQ